MTGSALTHDLQEVVRAGLAHADALEISTLRQVAERAAGQETGDPTRQIEHVLRHAIASLGEGALGQAAGLLFGVAPGTRGQRLPDRRRQAAEVYGIQPGSFRKQPQADLVAEVARALLELADRAEFRRTRQTLEVGEPTEERLAINWLERFEAYYRLWTPLTGLAVDLLAALNTQHSLASERETDDYMDFALYHYTCFSRELHRFVVAYGGLWLLSSATAEQMVSEAVHRVWWNTPLTERDDSWLRSVLADTAGQEMDPFLSALAERELGQALTGLWRDWLRACTCREEKPMNHCHVHHVIEQCSTYTRTIDEEWYRVAGWYREQPEMHDSIGSIEALHSRFT